MVTLASVYQHAKAVKATLEAAGLRVGDGVGKDDARVGLQVPYVVVFDIPGGTRNSGMVGDPTGDLSWIFQVTCVAQSGDEARWLEDEVSAALIGHPAPFAVPDRSVVFCVDDMAGGIQRDDDVDPPVFSSVPRYRLKSVPTGAQ